MNVIRKEEKKVAEEVAKKDAKIDLLNVAEGALPELFEREMAAVMKNIDDPNTSAKAPREITIKLKIIPHESRQVGETVVSVASKLAPVEHVRGFIHIAREGAQLVALTRNPNQTQLGFEPAVVEGEGK